MVFYFTSNLTNPPTTLYMGRDKFENEELIKYGLEEDIWFHVEKLSSAHVYLRMGKGSGTEWDKLPEDLVIDCAQLCKANSIEGNKKDNITVIYTPWGNLHKTSAMETGQVSFKNHKLVKRILIPTRLNPIVNRLNKTKEERYPDLAQEKINHERRKREMERNKVKKEEMEKRKTEEEKKRMEEIRNYSGVFGEESMLTNKVYDGRSANEIEEDFM